MATPEELQDEVNRLTDYVSDLETNLDRSRDRVAELESAINESYSTIESSIEDLRRAL